MLKFETGKTYATRSICDHDCIISVTIAGRTAKTVVVTEDSKTDHLARGRRFRVREYDGQETISPWGKYSMSPVISAGDAI